MRSRAPLVDEGPTVIWSEPREAEPQIEAPPPPEDDIAPFETDLSRSSLAAAAKPLLAAIVSLHRSQPPEDLLSLRQRLAIAIRRFERRAMDAGCPADDVVAARYMLCSALDEAVVTVQWGSSGEWSKYSLLAQFHNETWGGEKFFILLDRMRQDPQRYADLLALVAYLLALGFEGKYRVINNGRMWLEEMRGDIMRQLRPRWTETDGSLSPPAQPARTRHVLRTHVPLWVIFACAAFLVVALYIVYESLLLAQADPVIELLNRIGADQGANAN